MFTLCLRLQRKPLFKFSYYSHEHKTADKTRPTFNIFLLTNSPFLVSNCYSYSIMRLRALYYCKYTTGSHIFQSPDLHTLQEYLKRKGKELH